MRQMVERLRSANSSEQFTGREDSKSYGLLRMDSHRENHCKVKGRTWTDRQSVAALPRDKTRLM